MRIYFINIANLIKEMFSGFNKCEMSGKRVIEWLKNDKCNTLSGN